MNMSYCLRLFKKISKLFTAHPGMYYMTYYTHFLFAATLIRYSFFAVFVLIIHAFFPFLFENTGSRYLKKAVLMLELREQEVEAKKREQYNSESSFRQDTLDRDKVCKAIDSQRSQQNFNNA